ncbi:MAG: hypothetical protein UX47_C0001G0011 [Candidatus Collierbacteria bacterium GW2011_GWA2_46_26]|uniref:Uncharacterized protein n=1 Tax=Candidatus Collierbacteria bacterium GW2011_GWA2_46_26 TaxID=1618381 RepID=A0A0G1RUT9_9BACT|nr:MAG: hypothetical protein UW29_C0004G0222 [Candidatus Collierbacteria bacterium GW2011_GWC2_44_13]KKU33728.1 MAG: hypothetical protein UX47_C0001G0011 [Candidatus Collierbacteria bacterium GW2011_GWA2_46_26]
MTAKPIGGSCSSICNLTSNYKRRSNGFQTLSLIVSLTREELIGLIIDNKPVVTKTEDKPITLSGSGTYTNEPDYKNGGVTHIFFTNIDYQGEYLWAKANLLSYDGQTFVGNIICERYPDSISE